MSHEENHDAAALEVEVFTPASFEFQAAGASDSKPAPAHPAIAPTPRPTAAAPSTAAPTTDFYAVGIRLIKMSPVWLLTATCGFMFLILLLGWLRPAGGDADAATVPNDAKAVTARQLQPPAVAVKPAPAIDAPAVEQSKSVPETQPLPRALPVEAAPSKPEPAPATEQRKAAAPADDARGRFTIQVGSFNAASQANERISSLRASGLDARSVEVELPGKGTWYRVHVGLYATREEAVKAASQLREKGVTSSMVVAAQ
jgi:cell division protein FtsN